MYIHIHRYIYIYTYIYRVRVLIQRTLDGRSPTLFTGPFPHRFGVVAGILAIILDRRYQLLTHALEKDPGRPIPDRVGWPTFAEKKKFYDMCTKLTLSDLNLMVAAVQKSCPTAVQQCSAKEVEVRSRLLIPA